MTFLPLVPVMVFSTVVTGWFNLSEFLPVPLAVLAGAAWGAGIGLLGLRLRAVSWLEEVVVSLGAVGSAFAGCGGLMAILLLNGAMDSASLTGETLESTFLPSIPYYIAVNSILELVVIPLLIVLCRRRVPVLAAAALYFLMRVWTYLAFVPARMGWAESDHSAQVLTPAERHQAAQDLMLDDPRWIMLLVMFGLLLVPVRAGSHHGSAGLPAGKPAPA
ncbi:hypothetical protein [Paractinoplanes rishiriensis]|uniref:Uncharacterized protein n=1 Tax=Paractinoplanes rishiriensis TaxID=1050105 RepID=A0A919MU67_9ACTN|nr:hypothetical protein [Actinoplanes rishiriensis]GIE95483.1 hypothetical protein Ari01nite_29480 [Actinoplanes rishiriensis]